MKRENDFHTMVIWCCLFWSCLWNLNLYWAIVTQWDHLIKGYSAQSCKSETSIYIRIQIEIKQSSQVLKMLETGNGGKRMVVLYAGYDKIPCRFSWRKESKQILTKYCWSDISSSARYMLGNLLFFTVPHNCDSWL